MVNTLRNFYFVSLTPRPASMFLLAPPSYFPSICVRFQGRHVSRPGSVRVLQGGRDPANPTQSSREGLRLGIIRLCHARGVANCQLVDRVDQSTTIPPFLRDELQWVEQGEKDRYREWLHESCNSILRSSSARVPWPRVWNWIPGMRKWLGVLHQNRWYRADRH